MLLPPTALGELPHFFELDPLRFQGLCRDLYQVEPEIATADVFGAPGQRQRGVDIIAHRRDGDGIGVGQSKCIEPKYVTPALVQAASKELLEHLAYWKERRVRKFILFVAADISRTNIQDEINRQRKSFLEIGIDYELWGEAVIANKLRPRPGIAGTYLPGHWVTILRSLAWDKLIRDYTWPHSS